jgi:hypothetical protein
MKIVLVVLVLVLEQKSSTTTRNNSHRSWPRMAAFRAPDSKFGKLRTTKCVGASMKDTE